MDRSVFISYSHDDGDAVRRDAELLRAGGVLVFIDVRDIAYGERWRDVLREALLRSERVLVFWSAAARVSEWVDREWRFALELGKKVVPTLLDPTPLPHELAALQAIERFGAASGPPMTGWLRRQGPRAGAVAAAGLAVAAGASYLAWELPPRKTAAPPAAVAAVPPPLDTLSAQQQHLLSEVVLKRIQLAAHPAAASAPEGKNRVAKGSTAAQDELARQRASLDALRDELAALESQALAVQRRLDAARRETSATPPPSADPAAPVPFALPLIVAALAMLGWLAAVLGRRYQAGAQANPVSDEVARFVKAVFSA